MVLIPPKEPRRWGKVQPETQRWWQRYNRLRSEGFDHDESSLLAEGIIGSPAMREGRKARRRWYRELAKAMGRVPTLDELTKAKWELYDQENWFDEYSQFYQEATE